MPSNKKSTKKIDKKNSITFRLFQGGNDGKTTVWVPTNLDEQSEKAKETYEQIKQTLGDTIEEEEEEEEEPKVMYGLQQMISMDDDEEDDDYDEDDDDDEIGDEETEDIKKDKQRKTVGFLFPDDGYDYSKHIRNIGGGTYMSAFSQNSLQPSSLLYSESQAEEPVFSEEEDDEYEDVDDEDFEEEEEEEEPVQPSKKPSITSQKPTEKPKPTLEELIASKEEEIDIEEEEEEKKQTMDEPFKLKPDFKAYGLDKYASGRIDKEIETLLEEEEDHTEEKESDEKKDPLEKYGEDYDDFFGELVQELKEVAKEEEDSMYEDVDGTKVYQFDNDNELPLDLLKKFLPREELLLIEEEEAKKKKGGKTAAITTKPTKSSASTISKPKTATKSTLQKKVSFVDEEEDDDDEWEDDDGEDDDGEDDGDWEDVDDEEGEEGDDEGGDEEENDRVYTVSENRKQFDQDFESFYKTAYSDDQIGELDDDNHKLREGTEYDPKKMNDLLEDFFTEQRRKFGAGEFKRSNEITDEELKEIEANLPPDMKVYRREDFEKLNELSKEEQLKMAIRQLERQEKDEEKGETEVITIPEKDNRWDCETILTSYSNIYNHPSVIDDRPGRKKRIELSEKSGMPIGVVGKQRVDLNEEEIDEDDFEEVHNLGLPRKKGETKEEKKERKQMMKELKKQKREMKKTLKTTFKSEQMKQQKDSINPANQQKVVVKY